MHHYNFEKLEVWNLGISLVKEIYNLVKKFPEDEKYGLTSQIKRSAISIPTNIAEGVSRLNDKEKARYLEIAYGSAIEVLNHIIIARTLSFTNEEEESIVRTKINELTNKLNAFHQKLKKI